MSLIIRILSLFPLLKRHFQKRNAAKELNHLVYAANCIHLSSIRFTDEEIELFESLCSNYNLRYHVFQNIDILKKRLQIHALLKVSLLKVSKILSKNFCFQEDFSTFNFWPFPKGTAYPSLA